MQISLTCTQLKNHRVHVLAPIREPKNVLSYTENILRFNLSDDGMFLERKSSEFCRIVSGVRLTFDVRLLLQQRTLTAFFVLQLVAVDEASSNQPFHMLLVMSLECVFCLFGDVCVYTTTQQKKISCENHTLRETRF